jgi:hypothetical protein
MFAVGTVLMYKCLYRSAPCSQKADIFSFTSHNQGTFGSGLVTRIGTRDISGIAFRAAGGCRAIETTTGSKCLSTGFYNIFGVFWYRVASETPAVSGINGTQNADVYYLALPGEQRKPYSVTVVDLLNQADAIDWSTHNFEVNKLTIIQEIIAQHGDGLDEKQLAAISVRWFCPFIHNLVTNPLHVSQQTRALNPR